MTRTKYINRANELIELAKQIHECYTPARFEELRELCKKYGCDLDIETADPENGIENTRFWLFYRVDNETYIFDAFDLPENSDEIADITTTYIVTIDGQAHKYTETREAYNIRDAHTQIIYHWLGCEDINFLKDIVEYKN